jgi:acyl dehydratase
MQPHYFEDFKQGDRFTSPGLTITESAIVDFALTWDPQPFHIDKEFSKDWAYEGLIASGLHTLCASLRLWLALGVFAQCNMGSPGFEHTRFLKPVRPGDTIHVEVEIVEIRASDSKPDRGVARLRQITRNQKGEEVLDMETVVFLKKRAAV